MKFIKQVSWWKFLCILLLLITIILGLFIPVPARPILNETIRNYFFHVPMWVVMMTFFIISLVNSILLLRSQKIIYDLRATVYAKAGLFFGVAGLTTGMLWANFTWGKFWSNDPKQIGTVISLLVYCAYFILRDSVPDFDKRSKIAAVYNVFAFSILIPAVVIMPRMVDSLHPGGKGNPLINPKDVDLRMFIILWTVAVPGWLLLGFWISNVQIRIEKIKDKFSL